MKELNKTCAHCKDKKPVSQFNKQQKSLDGLHSWCRACGIAYKAERRQQQQERDKKFFNPNTSVF